MKVRKIRSRNYKKIIEVTAPIRFYWSEDGFDGVEFGPFDEKISKYQIKLIHEILNQMLKLADFPPGDDLSVFRRALE